MIDRQLAWSTPELIELSARFVPAADEVWRLQNGDDFECRLFRRFSEHGHYRGDESTRQGIYVVTPSGRLLGSANSRRPERIVALLRDGLARWAELTVDERKLTAEDREALAATWRFEDEFPADGLVLEVVTRDLPRTADADAAAARLTARPAGDDEVGARLRRWRQDAWNRDYAWFRAAEAAGFVPDQADVAAAHPVPRAVVERLVRFHLVDSVRGQTIPYAAADIERAELTARVVAVRGTAIELALTGATRAAVTTGEWPRSLAAELTGTATWDREQRRFVAFELVASGVRTGRTRYNERRDDLGPAPIGVVLRLAPTDAPRVAPTWVHAYGWERR